MIGYAHNPAGRRRRLLAPLILVGLVATICGEHIAAAGSVNRIVSAIGASDALTSPDGAPTAVEPDDAPLISFNRYDMVIAAIGVLALWLFFASRWHRLDRVPRRPPLLPPMAAVVVVVLLFIAGPIGAELSRIAFGARVDEPGVAAVRSQTIVAAGYYLCQMLVLLIPLVVWMQRSRRRPLRDKSRPDPWDAARLGLGGLLLFWPIIVLVSAISSLIATLMTGKPTDLIAHGLLDLFADNEPDGWMLLLGLLIVVAAPIVEEVMYRGIVQDALGRFGFSRWNAIILTSVAFTVMHAPVAEVHALPSLLVLSLGFGWMYEKTGRLAAPIAMHAAFNAVNLALAMMLT